MTDKYGRVVKGDHLSIETEFKKGQRPSPKTEFKKGNIPFKNPMNADAEIVMNGNIRVKLTNGKWGYKKRLVYERYNGRITNNNVIVFLDSDKLNCDINNLYRLSRKEIAVMNVKRLFTNDGELTLCGILYAKILLRCRELEKEQKS